MAKTTPIYDSQGRPVSTGALLGKGGEGSVFEICDRQAVVAKVYHQAVAPKHAAKLAAMSRLRTERLLRLSAWPIDTLHERPGASAIGLLMPRAHGKLVHQLYGPKSRLIEFPTADWRFLIHAASNVARAFHVIHEHGHVIGDVNHGNLLVSNQATVMLIDCDSFQINLPDKRYLCEVGIETHTPPELQGKRFSEIIRTTNHDNFGLAVLIFQLLFMGRHPFSGAYLGSGEMPIHKAITEHRFAYGPGAPSRQMKSPPGALALEAASPVVADLFHRAFGSQGAQSSGRPRAQEWIDGLDRLSRALKLCSRHSGHYYLNSFSTCPWCDVEGRAGILLFNYSTSPQPTQKQFDLALVWKRIMEVAPPGPLPPIPTKPRTPVAPSSNMVALGRQYRQGLGWITTQLGVNKQRAQSIANIQASIQAARTRYTALGKRWHSEASDSEFQKKRKELEAKQNSYMGLPRLRVERIKELEQNRERAQMQRYLDGIRLDNASISNIGQGRKATLQSFGIETAGDVIETNILAIPGFGPTLASHLIAWRRSVERNFRFNPTQGINPADIAAAEAKINQFRTQLEQELGRGAAELTTICKQIQQQRALLLKLLEETLIAEAQAEANLKVL